MIESIQFRNFKVLRDAKLPLGRCTVLVGPNGSGKTTVLDALDAFRNAKSFTFEEVVSAHMREEEGAAAKVILHWAGSNTGVASVMAWKREGCSTQTKSPGSARKPDVVPLNQLLNRTRVFSFDANAIAAPASSGFNSPTAASGIMATL